MIVLAASNTASIMCGGTTARPVRAAKNPNGLGGGGCLGLEKLRYTIALGFSPQNPKKAPTQPPPLKETYGPVVALLHCTIFHGMG